MLYPNVLVIEYWNLEIICYLVLEICDFIICSKLSMTATISRAGHCLARRSPVAVGRRRVPADSDHGALQTMVGTEADPTSLNFRNRESSIEYQESTTTSHQGPVASNQIPETTIQ